MAGNMGTVVFVLGVYIALHRVCAQPPSVAVSEGQWTQLFPHGTGPTGRAWTTGTSIGSRFYVTSGGNAKQNDTFAYDTGTQTWTEFAQLPSALAAADMTAAGGLLMLFGGRDSSYVNNLQVLRSTSSTKEKWNLITTTNSPAGRDGHSTVSFGGIVFVFGGWDETQYFNDMWAFDSTQLAANVGTQQWINIIPNGASGSPAARDSQTLVVMGGRLVLFGGFSHNLKNGPWVSCSAKDQCVFYNDVWTWEPPQFDLQAGVYNQWSRVWANRDVPNTPSAVSPTGRYGQVGAGIGDNLFIFGGRGAKGTLDDTWMFSFATRLWRKLEPTGALPKSRYSAAHAVVGGQMFMFSGTNGKDDLWVFTPPLNSLPDQSGSASGSGSTSGSGSGSPPGPAPPVSLGGVNAGLVIAILLSIATLVVVVLTHRKIGELAGAQGAPYSAMGGRGDVGL